MSTQRWTVEHVAALAPTPASLVNAEPIAVPRRWRGLGADDRALWGQCAGSSREPYDTAVDHGGVSLGDGETQPGWRCTCPSRRHPCKHALALMLMWVRDEVPKATRPPSVIEWLDRRDQRARSTATESGDPRDGDRSAETTNTDNGTDRGRQGSADPDRAGPDRNGPDLDGPGIDGGETGRDIDHDRSRDDRVARMAAGLGELERWLDDRMRTGLSDPAIAQFDTWDRLAARLVDAQVGSLANRVRRIAGLVGASVDWHERVLTELGVLHLIASAGLRVPELPSELGDRVAVAIGWQVRQADVLARAPQRDRWFVAGRSDQREDKIEVRRHWLQSTTTGEWALLLSFAAYQQSLDDSLPVGTTIEADLHRYPGRSLRALIGDRADVLGFGEPEAMSVAQACDAIGAAVAAEPWLERYPATISALATRSSSGWVLSDGTGSIGIIDDADGLAELVLATAEPVPITVEWTPDGVRPLTIHLSDRSLDVARRADASFVGMA